MGTEGSSEERSSSPRGWGMRALAGAVPLSLAFAGAVLVGCSGAGTQAAGEAAQNATIIARSDSFMEELAGPQFSRLSRAQRWRAVASLGTGLPPKGFEPGDLPESGSTGAGLLQAYCTQCHWLPTPQMHSATEWPILLRRMVLRMSLLERRVDGPFLKRVGGEELRSAVTFRSVPSADQLDSLQAYLTRNALPVAKPGELPTGAEASLFESKCTVCHQTPSPKAHTAAGWDRVVPRMQNNMRMMEVDTLTDQQIQTIEAFLRTHAARGGGQ
jgi:cytochrome c5